MKLGGLAIAKDGAIWTQSYVDAEDNPEELPDYVLKLGFHKHDGTNTHDANRSSVVSMTGVPIEYYELPTKNTILHRIAIDPCKPDDQAEERVWFTELGADRIGTIKFETEEVIATDGSTATTCNGERPRLPVSLPAHKTTQRKRGRA